MLQTCAEDQQYNVDVLEGIVLHANPSGLPLFFWFFKAITWYITTSTKLPGSNIDDTQAWTTVIEALYKRRRIIYLALYKWEYYYYYYYWPSDFSGSSLEARPQPIFTKNGSNDVYSRKDVSFAINIASFHTPELHAP